MTTTKKKRSARDKRIMVAAVIVAGTIVAGSTFAWFTSKDEVTNRLSASADYDVAIAEDFQPPENWVPGQEINKDVSAVNTGNVDAFVRMWLEGEMSVMRENSLDGSIAIPASITSNLGLNSTSQDEKMYDLGYKFYDADKKYYKVLSDTERANPSNNGTNTTTDDDDYSEVKAVQAGGYLVFAPPNAAWTYIAEQETEITNSVGNTQTVAKDTVIGSKNAASGTTLNVDSNCVIDSDTFTPVTPGLYIFRRNIDVNGSANTADSYEYSGYVFDGTNYFALYTDTEGKSDYSLPSGAVTVTATSPQSEPTSYTLNMNKIKLLTASETVVENSGLTWTYTADTKLTATYTGADALSSADDIVVDIALANVGASSEGWTALGEPEYKTFYYNNDLEAGDSTVKLVDSVTLSEMTTQKAFLAFDFDLNVFMDSIQVTKDNDGNETDASVSPWNGNSANQTAYGSAANTNEEITSVTWTTSAQ